MNVHDAAALITRPNKVWQVLPVSYVFTILTTHLNHLPTMHTKPERGIAKQALEKARFFADQAQLSVSTNRSAFVNYLEAAIVFARSATFHVQKEYRHEIGFDTWYAEHQQVLKADPISTFFLNTRNFIFKEGPVTVRKVVNMSFQGTIALSGTVSVKVIGSKPWYRRSPKIIWQDFRAPILQPQR
jgi:hypothetical protein